MFNYMNCPVISKVFKKDIPIISKVQVDDMTEIVQQCYDFEFEGYSKFYPYELPKIFNEIDFQKLVIMIIKT